MVLSFVFLKTRYKLINIMGVLLTVIGITCLVFADFNSSRNNGGSAVWLGDMLCLIGAVLYAAGNVTQEYLVKSHTILEYLGFIGVVGSFVSGVQLLALERMNIARIEWSPAVGGLFSGFGVSLFLFYSVAPWVIRMSSAVVFNLSLLTADFYSLIFGIFLFDYNFSGFYIMGFCLVVAGIFIYNLKHPEEKKFKERTQEQRRERSIERLYSVATTKVESSTEPGDINWKVRGLLESSAAESASDCVGILSDSYRLKIRRYGGTSTEMKAASSLSLSRYDSCHEGPLPYWGGRNLRDDRREKDLRGNGCHGNQTSAHVEIEAGRRSVGFSQSVPNYGMSGEGVGEGGGGGERKRQGEPEGKEQRNYSRQAGVGEEDERERKREERETLRSGPNPRRSSESSLDLQGPRGEVSPANRKRRRRRRSERASPHSRRKSTLSLLERGRDRRGEEEEGGFKMSSEESAQEKMVPVREREREGGGFN
ncbi:Solute carrier family 35 member F2 [Geodia barretti]|nr:Solute carrier family 35 member F2 [Geodia barretti]